MQSPGPRVTRLCKASARSVNPNTTVQNGTRHKLIAGHSRQRAVHGVVVANRRPCIRPDGERCAVEAPGSAVSLPAPQSDQDRERELRRHGPKCGEQTNSRLLRLQPSRERPNAKLRPGMSVACALSALWSAPRTTLMPILSPAATSSLWPHATPIGLPLALPFALHNRGHCRIFRSAKKFK